MSKHALFTEILDVCRAQTQRLVGAAKSSASGATSDEVRSEGKYDTRSVEASYLAKGQSEQAEAAAEGLAMLEGFTVRDFAPDEEIAAGALVETDMAGELTYFYLLPAAGGVRCDHEGFIAEVLTPEAPLYQALIGLRVGDQAQDGHVLILDVM